MENQTNQRIDYISAARRVNLPKLSVYLWTLVCLDLVKYMLCPPNLKDSFLTICEIIMFNVDE
jgi:hypothetical protein